MAEREGDGHVDSEQGRLCVAMQAIRYPLPGLVEGLQERYTLMQVADLDAHSSSRVSALVSSSRLVDRTLLDSLPNLQIICNTGAGVDKIDLDLCRQRGIRVANAGQANVVADTADMAIFLMLSSLRRLHSAHRFVQSGSWLHSSFPLARKASGLQVGIVGLGKIGQEIAKRAVGLKSIVSYSGPNKKANVPYAYYSDLLGLATNSDVLIVSCPLSKNTRHLIGKEVLDALGPLGVLVNVSRGPVVDELELCKALTEKRLGAAGLDVFEKKPHVCEELISMDNVVMSPHTGGATVESRLAVSQLILDNLNAFFSKKPLLTPVV